MITSPTATVAPTTGRVQLPDLHFSAYRAIVAHLQATEPTNRERIGRGLNVLLTAEIFEACRLGEYLVQSCANSGLLYRTTSLHCTCPDHQRHPELTCKHSTAITILHAACAEARFDRWTLTPKGEAVLAARA